MFSFSLGRGLVELRGVEGGEWGEWPSFLHVTSSSSSPDSDSDCAPCVTLDGIQLRNLAEDCDCTLARVTSGGRLRLQRCTASNPSTRLSGRGVACAFGAGSSLAATGCSFAGGDFGVIFGNGAEGELTGCEVCGCREAGVSVWGAGTCPKLAWLAVRDCGAGVRVSGGVDGGWELGEGNSFVNCEEGDVDDSRVHARGGNVNLAQG